MGLTDKVLGPSYKIKIIRRQLRSGRQDKTFEDRAAVVEAEESDQKQLKLKSDGKTIPKPSNLSFDQIQTSGFLSGGTKDFIEIEEDGDKVSFIDFSYDKDEDELNPERSEKEHIFQAHRNFMNKQTLEAWSQDDNKEILILGLIVFTILVNLAGQYFIINGLEQSVIDGIVQGFQNVDVSTATGS